MLPIAEAAAPIEDSKLSPNMFIGAVISRGDARDVLIAENHLESISILGLRSLKIRSVLTS